MLVISETPVLVILNEAIRLADRYGEEETGTFVNGVLDAAARRIRPGSLEPPAPGPKGEPRFVDPSVAVKLTSVFAASNVGGAPPQ